MTTKELLKLKNDPDLFREIMNYTMSFLGGTELKIPFRQRVWHFQNKISFVPKCKICNSVDLKWAEKIHGYRTYCSSKCAHADDVVLTKTEETNLTRYGAKSIFVAMRDKIAETNLKLYGAENPYASPVIQEKLRKISLDKYGVDNPSKSEEVKTKIDETHQRLYGRKRKSQCHMTQYAFDSKNNEDLMRHWFHDLKMPITEIAEVLGVGHSQLGVHFREKLNIDTSRHTVSSAERKLREFISNYTTNIIYNDRKILAPKELDIVIPDKNIAIEMNGLAWHGERMGKDASYHHGKYLRCSELNIRLFQITDLEYNTKRDIVHSRIANALGYNTTIYARKCEVQVVSPTVASKFFNDTHIQGTCGSTIRLGLFHDGELVACMSFGKARFNKHHQYELLRYSTKLHHTVVGGAGKLFRSFVREYSPESVISYCDLRWGTGKMYESIGFTLSGKSNPNYWYVRNGKTFESRIKYQKHKLSKILPEFDPSRTEWENMQLNGYDRFWDCGNLVFSWKR